MIKTRLTLISITIIVMIVGGFFSVINARGYSIDLKHFKLTPRGILLVKSDPEAAQIYLNGDLKGATNSSLKLAPGTYDLEVKKADFMSWYKRITIDKETVSEMDVALFRTAPSLTPLTFSGVINPVISPDYSKVVYEVPYNKESPSSSGLWVMETVTLPVGFNRDPRQITDGNLDGYNWQFSPDGRQILLSNSTVAYLLDVGSFTTQGQRVNIASTKQQVLDTWETEKKTKLTAKVRNLPQDISELLSNRSSAVVFSPDDTRVMYTASDSATLKDNLIPQLPGSSTQKQTRDIKTGNTYIYDIKEDRNFLIEDNDVTIDPFLLAHGKKTISWFPNSLNIIIADDQKVSIMDYDSTNEKTIFSGSYQSPNVYPFASTGRLLILTNLGSDSTTPNLYSLSLK